MEQNQSSQTEIQAIKSLEKVYVQNNHLDQVVQGLRQTLRQKDKVRDGSLTINQTMLVRR